MATYPNYDRLLKPGEGCGSKTIKERVAIVSRILADGGILPTVFGHCSTRIPGADRIYIMPHVHWQGKVIQEVTADDVCCMDFEGNPIDCDSIDIPEERFFHIQLYKARPDVGAVIYGHPRLSAAFAKAGRDCLTIFGERVPLMEHPGFGDVGERGQKVAKALGKGKAVVWEFGSVVVGRDIEEACVSAFALEREAETHLFVILLGGTPKPPTQTRERDQAEWRKVLEFPYFAAMDQGPRRKTWGPLFWR